MVNGIIIENAPSFWEKETEFIELYNIGETCKNIRDKLGLSSKAYSKLLKKCGNDGTITKRDNTFGSRKKHKKPPLFYHFSHGCNCFVVEFKGKYYATFKNKEQAEMYVRIMKEQHNWDWNMRKSLKEYILKKGVN